MTTAPDPDRSGLTPADARRLFRGMVRTPTAGWCAGWTQANLVAVPRPLAYDLLLFAMFRSRPAPEEVPPEAETAASSGGS